jgi:FMN reductase
VTSLPISKDDAMSEAFVVALGGTLRPSSSTERVLAGVLRHAEAMGAKTQLFAGDAIDLPMFVPGAPEVDMRAERLIEALRSATAIVIGSPGYHGGVSGLVKNALDYTEQMAGDTAPYFSGKPVGCVATGAGWQGCNATLQALRSIVHALRGWPTPLGIALNSSTPLFAPQGACIEPRLDDQMRAMAEQLVWPLSQRYQTA